MLRFNNNKRKKEVTSQFLQTNTKEKVGFDHEEIKYTPEHY